MATLTTFRDSLRLDLNDPAGASQRFADADLNRHIGLAQQEYQSVLPRLRESTLLTVSGSRDISLSTLTGVWSVLEVEWPTTSWPIDLRAFVLSFDRGKITLVVDAAPSAAENARVAWTSAHTIDATTSTIPEEHERVVVRGSYGFACLAYSTPASDNFKYQDGSQFAVMDDTPVPQEWRARGVLALSEFRADLKLLKEYRARGQGRLWQSNRVVWSEKREAAYWPSGPEREP